MTTVRLCRAAEVDEDAVKRVELADGRAVAVYRLDDAYFVTDDLCTHGEASLSEGEIEDGCILCPFHLGSFDIRTGEPRAAPCSVPLRTYEVRLSDGYIEIDA